MYKKRGLTRGNKGVYNEATCSAKAMYAEKKVWEITCLICGGGLCPRNPPGAGERGPPDTS